MSKVLVIQSRMSDTVRLEEQARYQRALPGHALSFVSSTDKSIAWAVPESVISGFNAVVIGGSSDYAMRSDLQSHARSHVEGMGILDRLTPLITYLVSKDFPFYGICFGHQLVARVMRGEVLTDPTQGKAGTYEVELTQEGLRDPLFSSLPSRFFAQYAHRGSVTAQPPDAVLLGKGNSCKFSVLRYGSRGYTSQFHPELMCQDLIPHKDSLQSYLLHDKSLVLESSSESNRLLSLFMSHVVNNELTPPKRGEVS